MKACAEAGDSAFEGVEGYVGGQPQQTLLVMVDV